MNLRTDIKTVVVAGSGVMGASLAQIFASHGYDVVLYDITQVQLDKASELIAINQKTLVERGEVSPEFSAEVLGRINYSLDKDCFRQADFVLETIVERMEVKQAFFREISELVAADVVMATNTSGLSISKLAEAVKGPERFVGMHFVNPPHLVALVEVIAGEKSLPQTTDIVRVLAESIEREHVTIHKDPPGFLLNRLQFAIMREAIHIVESGYASAEDVDKVMKHAMGIRYACVGPFEIMDFGGVDTFYNISNYLFADLCDRKDVPDLMRKAFEEGRLGVKSGRGIYDYSGDKAAKAIARRDAKLLAVSKCLRNEFTV